MNTREEKMFHVKHFFPAAPGKEIFPPKLLLFLKEYASLP